MFLLILQLQNLTSFAARSTTEQMPALVIILDIIARNALEKHTK
jgi:hypothetical protein